MSDNPDITIERQATFTETGNLETESVAVETSLDDFGADVDHRERESRLDRPEASEFGVDDRPEVTQADAGEQEALFVDANDAQRTLSGEQATGQCLFEDGGENDGPG
jgi:hypothetical protein